MADIRAETYTSKRNLSAGQFGKEKILLPIGKVVQFENVLLFKIVNGNNNRKFLLKIWGKLNISDFKKSP